VSSIAQQCVLQGKVKDAKVEAEEHCLCIRSSRRQHVINYSSALHYRILVYLRCYTAMAAKDGTTPYYAVDQSRNLQMPSFPLCDKPKCCMSRERMAPAMIERRTESVHITRPYFICTTCDNAKSKYFRSSGYPRGFISWDDGIGTKPQNPRCYSGLPSRQDRKGKKCRVKGFGEGF
jgi:hypothetical protein